MATFLQQILQQLAITDTASLKDACFVFPTRRAGHYFKEEIKHYYAGASFILPEIITIEDFVIRHCGYVIPDDLTLLLTLHELFNAQQAQPFEEFYPWGKMVLKDFEEVDKYMVDARNLYTVLQAHREMEEIWALEEESLQAVREFWENVDSDQQTMHKDRFLQTWQILGDIYFAFREKLLKTGQAHIGMAYRSLAESLVSGQVTLPYDRLVIAGFNALSVAEEQIFQTCLQKGNTHLFWDADQYYLDSKQQEAGNFIRHYQSVFDHPHCHWVIEDLLRQHKAISIHKVTSLTGQAQAVSRMIAAGELPVANTAIVLCDEQLLMPLLHALPAQENGINITMGYPVKHCVPYQLIDICFHLFNQRKVFSGQNAFFYKSIAALTGHTIIQQWIGTEASENIREQLTRLNRVWATADWIKEKSGGTIPQLMALLEAAPESGNTFGDLIAGLYGELLKMPLTPLDSHICFTLRENILQLNAVFANYGHTIPLAPYYKILRQHLQSGSIPFEGSNLQALQVMGFLETRVLDFENVVILSANEQHLPSPNRHRSFIPYHLRKGFGMSTFEEQDAIYAYHFYRLIQRTREANLFYNASGNQSDQEPSRFLLQLRKEHPLFDRDIDSRIPALPISRIGRWAERIIIPKDKKTMEMLQNRQFSPSSLITYLTCPMQFYLQYIAGLSEEESLSETMDNRIMGQILHKAMEMIYTPWVGKTVTQEEVKKMRRKEQILFHLKAAFEVELGESALDIAEGKNYLIFEILKDIVDGYLSWDESLTPFDVIGLEEKITIPAFDLGEGMSCGLTGRIDRRDRILIEGKPYERVVDYKTGIVHIASLSKNRKPLSAEEYIAQCFKPGAQNKEGFQGYMYDLLLQASHTGTSPRMIGFYSARNISDEISYVQNGEPVYTEISDVFRENVAALIREILDPNIPFEQNGDPKAYEYSPFADLVAL